MKVSKVTDAGDWTFGSSLSNYISKSPAVRQNVVTRLRSFKNDYFADMDAGGDWFNLFGQKGNEKQILREVERITLQTTGVRTIDKLEIIRSGTSRSVIISLEFTDLFDQNYIERVELV